MNDTLQKYETPDWKIKTSDSVADVMAWGKKSHWCTKGEHYANQYLNGGDLFALTKRGSRHPSFQLYVSKNKRIELRDREDRAIDHIDFFDQQTGLKELLAGKCVNLLDALEKPTGRPMPDGVATMLDCGDVIQINQTYETVEFQTVCEPTATIRRGTDNEIAILLTGDVPDLVPGDYYAVTVDGHTISGQLTHSEIHNGFGQRKLVVNLYST